MKNKNEQIYLFVANLQPYHKGLIQICIGAAIQHSMVTEYLPCHHLKRSVALVGIRLLMGSHLNSYKNTWADSRDESPLPVLRMH